MENETWEEVLPAEDANMVDSKWEITIKTVPDGTIDYHK
jgi:hypothetical protein